MQNHCHCKFSSFHEITEGENKPHQESILLLGFRGYKRTENASSWGHYTWVQISAEQIMQHGLYLHGDFPPTSSSYHLIVATREARVAASHSPNALFLLDFYLCLSPPLPLQLWGVIWSQRHWVLFLFFLIKGIQENLNVERQTNFKQIYFHQHCYTLSFLPSVQFSRSVMSNSLQLHGLQHARLHHQLPELTQTDVHCVGDAIQPSHPLSSPSPPALNLSQHQGLFRWVSSSHQWPKYWSFSFSISPSNEYSGLISFRIDCLDLVAVQGTLRSLLQHHSSKASILRHSAFFIVQLSHPYMTTGKTIDSFD